MGRPKKSPPAGVKKPPPIGSLFRTPGQHTPGASRDPETRAGGAGSASRDTPREQLGKARVQSAGRGMANGRAPPSESGGAAPKIKGQTAPDPMEAPRGEHIAEEQGDQDDGGLGKTPQGGPSIPKGTGLPVFNPNKRMGPVETSPLPQPQENEEREASGGSGPPLKRLRDLGTPQEMEGGPPRYGLEMELGGGHQPQTRETWRKRERETGALSLIHPCLGISLHNIPHGLFYTPYPPKRIWKSF